MTTQEYNDYIAHGGKWGFTNGVPNGKRKAEGLLEDANTLRKQAGKQLNKFGKQAGKQLNRFGKQAGKAIEKPLLKSSKYRDLAYGIQSRAAEVKMKRQMEEAGKKAKSKLSSKAGKEVVNTVDTSRYGKVKTSKSSQDAAEKYGKTALKVMTKYQKTVEKASKKYKNEKQSQKDFNRVSKNLEKKHGKTLDKYEEQMSARNLQKVREIETIEAAKRQDALRQQSSKSKKLEKTRNAQKELDKLHKSMYGRTKLYEGPKSLDDHKKENRKPKKHGQPSVTRGVRKQ